GACPRGAFAEQRLTQTSEPRGHQRRSGVDGQQQCKDEGDAEEGVHLTLPSQLTFLFLDQAIEFVEQLAISFADRVDDTGQYRLNAVRSVTEQSIDYVLFDPAIEIVARDHGGIQKRATVLTTLEQFLFEETIERGHQSRVGDALVEGAIDVAHADIAEAPRFFHDLAFASAESEAGDFARAAKSTQEKWSFHIGRHCKRE